MSKFLLLGNIHNVVKRHVTVLAASTAQNSFYFLQIHPFSSSFSSSPKSLHCSLKNWSSFTVNYLINSCGLTPERAASVSKHLSIKETDKADTVLAFFKDQGFTRTQISKLIHSFPSLLMVNPEKILLPKIEFLRSKGITGSEVMALVCKSPTVLGMSLEKSLIPSFNFFSEFLQSKENCNRAFKRFLAYPLAQVEKYTRPNIEMLKEAGVPIKNITFFLTRYPCGLRTNCEKFRRVLEEVKKMGFNPQVLSFLVAVKALLAMSKSTWDRKIKVYKQWGWSYDDIISAFRKVPQCMCFSEDKISSTMGYMVNEMGLKSSTLAYNPYVFSFSLEKRIIPRCRVYKVLVSKGLVKPSDTSLMTMIQLSEKRFEASITCHHGDEAPELMKLYVKKFDLMK